MDNNSPGINANPPAEEPKTEWTIMLYLTADGTLTNFAVESLKQLNEAVSKLKDPTKVKVVAHFSFPVDAANSGAAAAEVPPNEFREYVFPPTTKPEQSAAKANNERGCGIEVRTLPEQETVSAEAVAAPAGLSEKEAELKAFLEGVYHKRESKHYALIFWGHGPELLLQSTPQGNSTGDSNSLYLTPEELANVLKACPPPTDHDKLAFIGFDACFMSMLEMADELKERADYMVASQDEVPDLSFPYDKLIGLFGKPCEDATSLLTQGVQTYVKTYQDCICNNITQTNPVTLSALNLNKCGALNEAVMTLADALVLAKDGKGLPDALVEARELSQDYAGGLYVDISDFCKNLKWQLGKFEGKWGHIENACQGVINALTFSENQNPLILENGSLGISKNGEIPEHLFNSNDTKSHGISIYLPYLTDEQYAQVQRPLVKGTSGSHGGKGFGEALQGAGIEYLMSVRRDLILDTESYYERLQLQKDTHWYSFITQVWTTTLIKKASADLDYHYSAQQAWINVCRERIFEKEGS